MHIIYFKKFMLYEHRIKFNYNLTLSFLEDISSGNKYDQLIIDLFFIQRLITFFLNGILEICLKN